MSRTASLIAILVAFACVAAPAARAGGGPVRLCRVDGNGGLVPLTPDGSGVYREVAGTFTVQAQDVATGTAHQLGWDAIVVQGGGQVGSCRVGSIKAWKCVKEAASYSWTVVYWTPAVKGRGGDAGPDDPMTASFKLVIEGELHVSLLRGTPGPPYRPVLFEYGVWKAFHGDNLYLVASVPGWTSVQYLPLDCLGVVSPFVPTQTGLYCFATGAGDVKVTVKNPATGRILSKTIAIWSRAVWQMNVRLNDSDMVDVELPNIGGIYIAFVGQEISVEDIWAGGEMPPYTDLVVISSWATDVIPTGQLVGAGYTHGYICSQPGFVRVWMTARRTSTGQIWAGWVPLYIAGSDAGKG